MASIYKSLSKSNGHKPDGTNGVEKHKQRVLILSSRGVTYRHVTSLFILQSYLY